MLRAMWVGCVLLGSAVSWSVARAEAEPCKQFSRDVSHESELMSETPRPQPARRRVEELPFLQTDNLYELDLVPQSKVTFAAKPGKSQTVPSATAGIVGFKPRKAGRYRLAIASLHWLDVVDGKTLVEPISVESQQGCQRPRAVREYQLSAGREYSVQLSGAPSEQVLLTITEVQASK